VVNETLQEHIVLHTNAHTIRKTHTHTHTHKLAIHCRTVAGNQPTRSRFGLLVARARFIVPPYIAHSAGRRCTIYGAIRWWWDRGNWTDSTEGDITVNVCQDVANGGTLAFMRAHILTKKAVNTQQWPWNLTFELCKFSAYDWYFRWTLPTSFHTAYMAIRSFIIAHFAHKFCKSWWPWPLIAWT